MTIKASPEISTRAVSVFRRATTSGWTRMVGLSWARKTRARAAPSAAVPPSSRAALAPSCAAASAMWIACSHSANCTTSSTSNSRSGVATTSSVVAAPRSARRSPMDGEVAAFLLNREALGLFDDLVRDVADCGEGGGQQHRRDDHGLGGVATLAAQRGEAGAELDQQRLEQRSLWDPVWEHCAYLLLTARPERGRSPGS